MTSSKSKTIIVTGGSRGIGKAIAEALKLYGYDVRTPSRAQLDLSKPDSIKRFTSGWKEPLYGLVNDAGILKVQSLDDNGDESWDEVMAVNLTGPYLLAKGLQSHIQDNGRILNISSQLGKDGRAGYSAYCASKFGLIGLTKVWARELASRGITVNAICPGWVDTDMSRDDIARMAKEKGYSAAEYAAVIERDMEAGAMTKPQDVARFAAFLISADTQAITGQDMLMNSIWNQE